MMTSVARRCPLCGETCNLAAGLEVGTCRGDGQPYQIITCASCGLCYTDPLPSRQEVEELYGQSYYVQNRPRLLSRDFLRLLFHAIVRKERAAVLHGEPVGRVLDIGCGAGDFLADASRRGWEVFATDLSPAACTLATARGIPTHHGELIGAGFSADSFDVVTAWHVLEHLPEPRCELAEIQRILRPGGLLIVQVPNSASPTFRLVGRHWYPLDAPRHLQHFTPRTLGMLLEQAGFEVIRRKDYHISDFSFASYSALRCTGLTKRLGISAYSTDFKRSSLLARLGYMAAAIPLTFVALPYSLGALWLSGHGESLTFFCRKK